MATKKDIKRILAEAQRARVAQKKLEKAFDSLCAERDSALADVDSYYDEKLIALQKQCEGRRVRVHQKYTKILEQLSGATPPLTMPNGGRRGRRLQVSTHRVRLAIMRLVRDNPTEKHSRLVRQQLNGWDYSKRVVQVSWLVNNGYLVTDGAGHYKILKPYLDKGFNS